MSIAGVHYDVRTKMWELLDEVYYEEEGILVPKGFKTDLASIPRPLWVILASFELSLEAPILHDFLYRAAGKSTPAKRNGVYQDWVFSRCEADRAFRREMGRRWINFPLRFIAYWGVRIFAGSTWRDYLRKNKGQ